MRKQQCWVFSYLRQRLCLDHFGIDTCRPRPRECRRTSRCSTEVDTALEDELRSLFLSFKQFSFHLASTRTFPDILYLEPTPSQPFSDLINAIVSRYPENLPYGGTFSEVIPHLTIVHSPDPDELECVRDEFIREFSESLPIHASVDRVWLMEKHQEGWEERTTFALS